MTRRRNPASGCILRIRPTRAHVSRENKLMRPAHTCWSSGSQAVSPGQLLIANVDRRDFKPHAQGGRRPAGGSLGSDLRLPWFLLRRRPRSEAVGAVAGCRFIFRGMSPPLHTPPPPPRPHAFSATTWTCRDSERGFRQLCEVDFESDSCRWARAVG